MFNFVLKGELMFTFLLFHLVLVAINFTHFVARQFGLHIAWVICRRITRTRGHSPMGGNVTVQLVSSFTSLDSAASVHTKPKYSLPWSSPVLWNWRPAVAIVILPQLWVFSGRTSSSYFFSGNDPIRELSFLPNDDLTS